jgi:hypothetical protein
MTPQFDSEHESPLAQEIRRVHEIEMRQLREKSARESALFERRNKKCIWRAWWAVEWWFRDLFRKAVRARPKLTPVPASNSEASSESTKSEKVAFVGFVGRCLKTAFKHAKGTVDLVAGLTGMVLPFVVYLSPKWLTPERERSMNALYLLVPMSAASVVVLARLAISPYWVFLEDRKRHAEREAKLTAEIEKLAGQLTNCDESPLTIAAVEKIISGNHSSYAPAAEDEKRCQISITNNSSITVDWVKVDLVDIYQPILRQQPHAQPFDFPLMLVKKDGKEPGSLHPKVSVSVDLFDATLGRNTAGGSTVELRIAHRGIIASLTLDAEFVCRLRASAKDTPACESNYRVNFSATTHRFTMEKI